MGPTPPQVEAFRQKILAADSILFASPEYNYSVASMLAPLSVSSFIFGENNFLPNFT